MVEREYGLNKDKYKNAILYFAKKVGSGAVYGRKKLYKLFYFLDFDFFEKYDKPLTGDIYHKIQMGPAPSYLDAYALELKEEGALDIVKHRTGGGYEDTVVYRAVGEPNLSVFSNDEVTMLKRIVRLYGDKTGKELEILTQKEAPYLAVERGEEIPLELAHYRGTFPD
jgi:uncharacterized phage-associated protein